MKRRRNILLSCLSSHWQVCSLHTPKPIRSVDSTNHVNKAIHDWEVPGVAIAIVKDDDVAMATKIDELFVKRGSPVCALGVVRDGQVIYKKGYGWPIWIMKFP